MERKGLIIYPPNQLMDVETPRPDGSLGPLYLSSALESRGIATDVLDASVGGPSQALEETFYRNVRQDNGLTRIGMGFDEIAEYVAHGGYDFVGINSNFTPQTKMAFATADAIKRANPNIEVYSGGVNARALKERFLCTGNFDGICLTEGELSFPEAILNGVRSTPGFAYLEDGRVRVNPIDESCFPNSLDDLCMPAWDKLPLDKYEGISSPHGVDVSGKPHKKYAPIMTSRGCKWSCLYCHNSTEKDDIGKFRAHSVERVIDEVDRLKSLGIEKLFFEDDSLLHDRKRVEKIFSAIKDRGLSIADTNGVNLMNFYNTRGGSWDIDYGYIDMLRDAGFEQLVFPVESGSQRILKKYATNKVLLDKMDVTGLMRAMTDRGIQAPVNMMTGFPDETEAEMIKSVDLGKRLIDAGAPYVTFFIPIPFPGSKLYDIAISGGHLDLDFDTDIFNWKRPVMKNTLVAHERVEEIRDIANETVNTKSHLRKRLEDSVGHRWNSK